MKELETVVLRRDLPEFDLKAGDIGAVVHRHASDAFEVEFVTGEGVTITVATLRSSDLRSIGAGDILHVRSVARP
jgi:hypothetical protein